jgi:hypothetical protein
MFWLYERTWRMLFQKRAHCIIYLRFLKHHKDCQNRTKKYLKINQYINKYRRTWQDKNKYIQNRKPLEENDVNQNILKITNDLRILYDWRPMSIPWILSQICLSINCNVISKMKHRMQHWLFFLNSNHIWPAEVLVQK